MFEKAAGLVWRAGHRTCVSLDFLRRVGLLVLEESSFSMIFQ